MYLTLVHLRTTAAVVVLLESTQSTYFTCEQVVFDITCRYKLLRSLRKMPVEETVKWIQDDLVPRIMLQNAFINTNVTKCEVSPVEGLKDNWASMMFEIRLETKSTEGQKVVAIIVKLMDESEKVRKFMQSEKQFANEILMYSTAVPFFLSLINSPAIKSTVQNLFPQCYYTHITTTTNSNFLSLNDGIVALENLKNFKLGDRTFLNLTHCIMAMEKLGSFHALSYFAKERDLDTFKHEVVSRIQETIYALERRSVCNKVFAVSEQRVLEALSRQLPGEDPGLARLRGVAARDAFDVYVELVTPTEPLAVLCHGDFLRNNVLYRYVDEAPVDMKFVDFQTVRYASPAIDVFLFLCMNTSHELRSVHLNELLKAYHESLAQTLTALQGEEREQLDAAYSFDAFIEDFRTHALYGYLISIYFIPWMMANEEDLAEYVKLYREEVGSPKYLEKERVIGGDAVTTVLVELANDLIQHGYL